MNSRARGFRRSRQQVADHRHRCGAAGDHLGRALERDAADRDDRQARRQRRRPRPGARPPGRRLRSRSPSCPCHTRGRSPDRRWAPRRPTAIAPAYASTGRGSAPRQRSVARAAGDRSSCPTCRPCAPAMAAMSARSFTITVQPARVASSTTVRARSRNGPLSHALTRSWMHRTPADRNARATSSGARPARAHASASTIA